jgi:hypothetical protein
MIDSGAHNGSEDGRCAWRNVDNVGPIMVCVFRYLSAHTQYFSGIATALCNESGDNVLDGRVNLAL